MTYLDEAVASTASTPFELHAGALRLALQARSRRAPSPASGTAPRRSCARGRPAALSAARGRRCTRSSRTRTGSATGAFAGRGRDYTTAANVADSPIRCTASAGSGRGRSSRQQRARGRARARCTAATPTGRSRSRRASTSRSAPIRSSVRLVSATTAASGSRPASACIRTSSSARAAGTHRALASLGQRLNPAADTQGRAAQDRQRPVAPRLRQLLRGLARPGADPRRALLAAADVVAAPPRGLHAGRAWTTSASSR